MKEQPRPSSLGETLGLAYERQIFSGDVGLRGVHRCPRGASYRLGKDSKSRGRQKTLFMQSACGSQMNHAKVKIRGLTGTMAAREALRQTVGIKS